MRACLARKHGFGDCFRTDRRWHLPGETQRAGFLSFRKAEPDGNHGSRRLRLSAAANPGYAGGGTGTHGFRERPAASGASGATRRRGRAGAGVNFRNDRAAGLPSQITVTIAPPGTENLPAPSPNAPHAQVDAPFVFRARDPPPASAPDLGLGTLPMSRATTPAPVLTIAEPPTRLAQGRHRQGKGLLRIAFQVGPRASDLGRQQVP